MKRIALALLTLSLLAGCGIKGGLERPDPMWNRDEAMRRDQEREARQREIDARRAGHSVLAPAANQPAPSTGTSISSDPNAPTQPAPAQ